MCLRGAADGKSALAGRGEAGVHVFADVGGEGFFEFLGDQAGGGGDFATVDFTDAEQVAIRGGDEDFLGDVEVFGEQRALFDRGAGRGANLHKDAAGDAFEAAGGERRGGDAVAADAEDVCRRAFGHFTAFVEHDYFVEAVFMRFVQCPHVGEP